MAVDEAVAPPASAIAHSGTEEPHCLPVASSLRAWKMRSRPVEGSKVQRVNEYRFYKLGQSLNALKSMSGETTHQEAWWSLWTAREEVGRLLNDPLPLKVCRPAAKKLLVAIDAVIPRDVNKALQGPAKPDSQMELLYYGIDRALVELEPVLAAECDAMDTYVVSRKGIYNTSELIESADQILPEQTRSILPEQTLRDLREAGRCLAFDLDTACGFHLMRATETVIHAYYVEVTGHTPKRKDRNWGAYVRNFNAHRKQHADSKVDPKLVILIDQIREHHRNVLMHPEESLTEDDALSLFGVCQSAIISFARGIQAVRGAV